MARSIYQVSYRCGFPELRRRLEEVLMSSGYRPYLYEGENIWKKGTGAMTAMMYIKIEYDQTMVAFQGWVMPGLGSAEIAEMGLDGALGVIPKKACQKVIDQLIAAASA